MEDKNTEKMIDDFEKRNTLEVVPHGQDPRWLAEKKEQDSFLATIERLARMPDVDPVKLKQIMDMQERVLNRNAKQAFNADMMKAQGEMPIVPYSAKNEQTRSEYSLYKTILKKAKPVYTKYGFSIMFYEGFDSATDDKWPKIPEGHIRTFADVMHTEGHTKTVYIDMPTDDKGIKGTVNKTGPHAKKSSVSYSRGALICMVFNIATGQDDDDGNAAGNIKYVTKKQIKSMQKLIDDKKVDTGLFFTFVSSAVVKSEITKLEEIPKSKFGEVMNALKNKKKPEREPGQEG